MHLVVGIHDAEDLDLRGEPRCGFVERSGLEARPVLEMHEGEARPELRAELLDRLPERRVGGVVVDDLDDEMRIVDLSQRFERGPDHLDGLVVRGDLERDPRLSGERGRRSRRRFAA